MLMIHEEEGEYVPTNSAKSDEKQVSKLHETCIRLLARREHSRKELAIKLRQRGFGNTMVESELDRLEEEGYLSDARFRREKTRSLILQDYGPRYIRSQLQKLDVKVNDEELEALYEELEVRPNDQVNRLIHKKLRSILDGNTESRDLKKIESQVARYLVARGFDFDTFGAQLKTLESGPNL